MSTAHTYVSAQQEAKQRGVHITQVAAYWYAEARNERASAAEKRGSRYGTVESIRIHLQNAAEYEARAKQIEQQQAGG